MHCRSTTSPFLPRPLPPVTVCRHCYLGPWPHRFADARSAAVRETHLGPARDLQPHMCSFAPTLHPHEHDTPHMMPLQVCYAKAVRAHARKAARRAEGGKERERPPSGAAEGGSKRERENEAFGPLARQLVRDKIRVRLRARVIGLGTPPPYRAYEHAERAVLVVPQLSSPLPPGAGPRLASKQRTRDEPLNRRVPKAEAKGRDPKAEPKGRAQGRGPKGGCVAAVRLGRSCRCCAFPTPGCGRAFLPPLARTLILTLTRTNSHSCGRASASADPSEGGVGVN